MVNSLVDADVLKGVVMAKYRLIFTLFLSSIFLITACGSIAPIPPNTIVMNNSLYENDSLTVTAGTSVTFDSQGPHVLVTGKDGGYQPEAGAPLQLNSAAGVNFTYGDKKSFIFDTTGVYHITCIVHPAMNATITVK